MKLTNKNLLCWSNGEFVEEPNKISTLSVSLNYGICAWEGIRAYGDNIIALEGHLARLKRSAEALKMEIPPHLYKELVGAINALVFDLNVQFTYIRPLVYLLDADEVSYFEDRKVGIDLYAFEIDSQLGKMSPIVKHA